jgi:hypothetical protein
VVHLFDDAGSVCRSVAEFLREGAINDETLLVVTSADHWETIAARLETCGHSVDRLVRSSQLTVRDSREMLNAFMKHQRPDRALFDSTVGALVRELSARGRPVRIYGDMVDALAAEGAYDAAVKLERLWNQLVKRERLVLYCGYAAVHFGDPRSAAALRAICRSHSHIKCGPDDELGSFLFQTHVGEPSL